MFASCCHIDGDMLNDDCSAINSALSLPMQCGQQPKYFKSAPEFDRRMSDASESTLVDYPEGGSVEFPLVLLVYSGLKIWKTTSLDLQRHGRSHVLRAMHEIARQLSTASK